MPIYEYVCEDCNTRYERIVLSSSTKITCPRCASRRHALQLSVFSAPAKGSVANGKNDGGALPASACACGAGGCGRN
jgi:putative FmdB family regulatory protein